MSRKRHENSRYKSIDIEINSTQPTIINWLLGRLFLLKAKFSFHAPDLEQNDYIRINNILKTPSGLNLIIIKNGKEVLGEIEIVISKTDDGNANVNYSYPTKVSSIVTNLVLDIGVHFNLLNNIPQDIFNTMTNPEIPFEEGSSILELELFFEDVTANQFCDWLVAESKDILSKLFPTLGWLLEIQPPKISIQSNYERKVEMEGRLYKHAPRGLALFLPNPPTNQECVCFEIRELSSKRLRVICRANNLAIEYFRKLLGKIEHNWPETKENIKRFLVSHRGESVVPVVSMGPTINVATGEIVPEEEKYYRAEYRFRGTPLQFSAFITNYAKALSVKHKNDIIDLISSTHLQSVQVKTMFFPINKLDSEHQKGVFGEIVVQSLQDQSSMLIVEAERRHWNKLEKTWDIILSELKRQGWVIDEDSHVTLNDASLVSGDVFISYSHKDKEYAHNLASEFGLNAITPWIDDRIDYGTRWPQVVQDNLNACPIFVVIMSSNAYKSNWVQNEVSYAQMKSKKIFPLLLEGEAWLSLAATQHVDVKGNTLPPKKFFATIKKEIDDLNKE